MVKNVSVPAVVPVRVLGARDLRRVLPIGDCIDALERVFQLTTTRAQGFVGGAVATAGTFHIKAALADVGRPVFVAKLNANFPDNPRTHGLPTVQGMLLLSDGADGRPLAIMDAATITIIRTAAASAVAARRLAPVGARRLAIVGCGAQALTHAEAMRAVRPIEQIRLFDRAPDSARRLASVARRALDVDVQPVDDLGTCVRDADIIVTCTTTRRPLLRPEHAGAGCFVAAVGADSPDKNEITPALMAAAVVVADDVEQCSAIGDLHHAIASDAMRPDDVWTTLGELVQRSVSPPAGRPIVFDSTGIPVEDLAAAALAFERATAADLGVLLSLE